MRLSYTELIRLPTFEERFDYLKQGARVAARTFGGYRALNQNFYKSKEWKTIRDAVILRDNACDLAHPDFPLYGDIRIHHINPITVDELLHSDEVVIDMDNLVVVSFKTHNAIHYSKECPYVPLIERRPNDTCPWK